jgi:hypothetical protein
VRTLAMLADGFALWGRGTIFPGETPWIELSLVSRCRRTGQVT